MLSLQQATELDLQDPIAHLRKQFYFPQHKGADCIYLTGNSLGLQPKSALRYLETELEDWAAFGVEGHFHARNPWFSYHHPFKAPLATLVGAQPEEVVAMGGLTGNLHNLLISFYCPSPTRNIILMEGGAFPSDYYMLESQVKLHGLNAKDHIVELWPRDGEHQLRTEDILQTIHALGDKLALVFMGAVNYYTGQFFDLESITKAAHEVGALAGFDLAHAIGNVPMKLHDWQVDFAAWCSYKYLNSGPGAVAGLFVHETFAKRPDLQRLAGWWGYDESQRFQMKPNFIPMEGADGWQQSNAPVFSMAILRASLDIFSSVGIHALREKSLALSGYLYEGLTTIATNDPNHSFQIISPADPNERGAQVSTLWKPNIGKQVFDIITSIGVIADWREPNVIRLAPVPLYNSYADVANFLQQVSTALASVHTLAHNA